MVCKFLKAWREIKTFCSFFSSINIFYLICKTNSSNIPNGNTEMFKRLCDKCNRIHNFIFSNTCIKETQAKWMSQALFEDNVRRQISIQIGFYCIVIFSKKSWPGMIKKKKSMNFNTFYGNRLERRKFIDSK